MNNRIYNSLSKIDVYSNISYLEINSGLTLSQKYHKNGWKNLEQLSLNINKQCESENNNYEKCLDVINDTIIFTKNSNLKSFNKIEVENELLLYKQLFINKVEAKRKLDSRPLLIKNNIVNLNHNKKLVSKSLISSFAFSILLVLLVVGVFKTLKLMKNNYHQKVYRRFFKLQKINNVHIRLFGILKTRSLFKLDFFTRILTSIFSLKATFFGELHFKFKECGDQITIDTLYFSEDSLHFFYEDKESEVFSKLQNLILEVEKVNGEVVFTTKFNRLGEIEESLLSISIPK